MQNVRYARCCAQQCEVNAWLGVQPWPPGPGIIYLRVPIHRRIAALVSTSVLPEPQRIKGTLCSTSMALPEEHAVGDTA